MPCHTTLGNPALSHAPDPSNETHGARSNLRLSSTHDCQNPQSIHDVLMKLAVRPILSAIFAGALSSCFNNPPPPVVGANFEGGVGPFDSRGNYVEAWADDPSKWRRPSAHPPRSVQNTPPETQTTSRPAVMSTPPPTAQNTSRPTAQNTSRPTAQTTSRPTVQSTPPPTRPKVKTPETTRYTVKKGDTLSGIASRFHTSASSIAKANRISGSMIRPGQRLTIPGR
jgi:LysM repeat protein